MSATAASHSIVLWQLQTHVSAASWAVLHRTVSLLTPRRKLHSYHTTKPPIPACVFNNGREVIVNSNSASTTTPTSVVSSDAVDTVLDLGVFKQKCRKWQWKGQYSINYFVSSDLYLPQTSPTGPPLLLVHGFGASVPHWRSFHYKQLILDFLDEVIQEPTVLIGNSVGSLACVIAASDSGQTLVRGLVLLNCAGGMNNKAIVDDWRIKLLLPLLWLVDFLLNQKGIASAIFERVKQRENLRDVLLSVYGNKEYVDEELVEIIREPANDVGALDAFVSIVTGPPGPNPVQLMPRISLPVLVLWGDQDPFTPIDGPVGRYFSSLSSRQANVKLFILEGVGHCPHDDRPDSVHEKLLPWLASLPTL
ncbi:pheophytinase, chloroplastic isoform X2 [Prosopis cineraria]|uniref:pheophytinase, chloroplastic isoform X2 n=1 Tax=Prosopis cineraria TaxID=364024 RepID=UPI00240F9B77|nr:pheophytinase, chloroplastic isoform X2 [Prosopis cineraria]